MVFRFNIEKTIQAIAVLLHFHGSKEMADPMGGRNANMV